MDDLRHFNGMVKRTLTKLGSTETWEVEIARKQVDEYFNLISALEKVHSVVGETVSPEKPSENDNKFCRAPEPLKFNFDIEDFKKKVKTKK